MNIPLNISPLGFAHVSTPVEPSELPAGYTRLAFIYGATGSRAYADTLVQPAENIGLYWTHYVGGSGNEQGFSTWSSQGAAYYFACTINRSNLWGFAFAGSYQDKSLSTTEKSEGWLNWLNSKQARIKNSSVDDSRSITYGRQPMQTVTLGWSRNNYAIFQTTRIFSAKISENDTIIRDFYPVVSPAGEPGFYDILTQTFLPNLQAGAAFGCGLETLDQLTALASNLPTVTGAPEINLSLPGEWNGDASANAQLSIITGKGWSTTISYRDVETSTSSSFVLGNRGDGGSALVLWCRAVQSDSGNYQDAAGVRYYVETCHDIWHPSELSPDDLGYSAALTLEDYLTAQGLTAVEYPEEELSA